MVSPLLHNRLPAAVVESVEFPQLFTTLTTGVEGIEPGNAIPLPVSLVQPFAVEVTV